MIQHLDVFLWNKKVGSIVTYHEKYREKICFYFDSEFVNGGYDIAPLRASIHSPAVINGLPVYADEEKIFGGLPSFLADSLPDFWGNKVFARWAKSRNISSRNLSALDRLSYIGRRGMGALEFLPPAVSDMEQTFKVEIDELYAMAQTALSDAKAFKLEFNPDSLMESLFKVGTSAGGRRPKAIINVNMQTGDCYSGQVPAPFPGYIPMIVKFDEHSDVPTTRIEYSYYLMAKDAGLDMMPSYLLQGKNAAHFLTERFDRMGDRKIHMQTLAAMLPYASSYEDLFEVAGKIGIMPGELRQMFLQMVLNVLACNVDDHNKNFAFLMGDDGVWHIAPAYDFTFAVDTSAPSYVNRHCMTIGNKNFDISRGDLLSLAECYNIKGAEAIIDKAVEVVSAYSHYADLAGVPAPWSELINEEIAAQLKNNAKIALSTRPKRFKLRP